MLKNEERIARDRIREYEIDNTHGINLRPRLTKYKINDAAIKSLVIGFDGIHNPTPDQYLHRLKALQYRLAKNQFDNWCH